MKPRLLLFELRMMGDGVMAFPFVRAARERYELLACVSPAAGAALEQLLDPAQLITWTPPWSAPSGRYAPGRWRRAGLGNLVQRLRAWRPDVAVCAWADPRVHGLMARSGAPRRVSFSLEPVNQYAQHLPWRRRQLFASRWIARLLAMAGGGRLLTDPVRRSDYWQHHVLDWSDLAGVLGMPVALDRPWVVPPAPPESTPWLRFLEAERAAGRAVWLVHPGSRSPMRRWPLEHFLGMVRWIVEERGESVCLVQPPELPPIDITGPHRLGVATGNVVELFQLASRVDQVLCNDTGISHIAAAVGKPVVSIFGASSEKWFAPFGEEAGTVFSERCPHRPCFDRCLMPSYVCLEGIDPAGVRRRIEERFPARKAASP